MITNFNDYKYLNNYKFLYYKKGNYPEDYYEIWSDSYEKLEKIANRIKSKNLKYHSISWCDSTMKVKKAFNPVPNFNIKQLDNYYHAYIALLIE